MLISAREFTVELILFRAVWVFSWTLYIFINLILNLDRVYASERVHTTVCVRNRFGVRKKWIGRFDEYEIEPRFRRYQVRILFQWLEKKIEQAWKNKTSGPFSARHLPIKPTQVPNSAHIHTHTQTPVNDVCKCLNWWAKKQPKRAQTRRYWV